MRESLRWLGFLSGTSLFLILGADLKAALKNHTPPQILGEGMEWPQAIGAVFVLFAALWIMFTDDDDHRRRKRRR